MRAVVPVVLAAAAASCLAGVPRRAAVRLDDVVPSRSARERAGRGRGPQGSLPTAEAPEVPARRPSVALWWVLALPAAGTVAALVGAAFLVPAALLVTAALVVRRLARERRATAAREAERAQAVEACAGMAAELRAGRTPAEALQAAAELATGPFAAALASGASALRLGGDAAAALGPPPGTAVPGTLRALIACWTVCAGSGSGLATAVERLADGLRAEQSQRRAVQAELAGPRATAALLAVLPAGGLLLAAGLGADPLAVLLTTPLGLVCLVLGLGLDAAGVWWTGRLVGAAGGRS